MTASSGGLNELEIPFGSESFVFIDDNYPNFSAIDTHGDTTADERGGTKIVELYNNRIEQSEEIDFFHGTSGVNNPGFAGTGLRGGKQLFFDNVIANF